MFPTAIGMLLAEALTYLIPPDPSVAMIYDNMTIGWAVPFVLFYFTGPRIRRRVSFSRLLSRQVAQTLESTAIDYRLVSDLRPVSLHASRDSICDLRRILARLRRVEGGLHLADDHLPCVPERSVEHS